MTFVKGQKKPEGSGRQKGRATKRNKDVAEILRKYDFCPIAAQIAIYQHAMAKDEPDLVVAQRAANSIAPYAYAKLANIEISRDPDTDAPVMEVNLIGVTADDGPSPATLSNDQLEALARE